MVDYHTVDDASYLIENYAEAPQTERALVILVRSKRQLGLNRSADEALAVLS
jgi:outer membrane protein assembly factor BamD (BamD/ComL family)